MKQMYLVLETNPNKGPLSTIRSQKLNKTWDSLQDALDELGSQGWVISNTIYGPTGEPGLNGDHFCESFIMHKT